MAKTVLIVDDDADICQLLSLMLTMSGYQPLVALDGLDAWQQIQQAPPDLIILDVMMPRMDGLTLCKKLRREADTADLPVIMLSGKAHPEAIEEGLRAGADCYLTKPMEMKELRQEMGTLLERRAQRQLEV